MTDSHGQNNSEAWFENLRAVPVVLVDSNPFIRLRSTKGVECIYEHDKERLLDLSCNLTKETANFRNVVIKKLW